MIENKVDDLHLFCMRCKKVFYEPDFYAQNSRKWCKQCAKIVKKENDLKNLRAYRQRAKQKRQQEKEELRLTHDLNSGLKEEIRLLQRLIQMQREQLDSYINPEFYDSETISNMDIMTYYQHHRDVKKGKF